MWGRMPEPTPEPMPPAVSLGGVATGAPAVHYSIAERIRAFIQDIEAHVSHAELEVEGWVVTMVRKLP